MIRPNVVLASVERLGRLPVYRETVLPLVRHIWVPAVLGGILLLAAAVRIYGIVGNPPGFFCDEASFGYNAYSVMHTGKDEHGEAMPLFFRSFDEYKLPVYIYSQIPFIAVLGLSELPVRLTSAAYGVLTVLAVYLLVWALFRDKALALTAAAVLAILPWHIHYSRTGLGDIIVHPFFLVLGSHLFIIGTRRPRYWPAAALAFVFALYSYRSAWVITPPLVLLLAVLYHQEVRKHWRISLPCLLIVAIAGVPIILQLLTVDTDRARDQSLFSLGLGRTETIETFFRHYRSYFTTSFLFEGPAGGNLRHYLAGFGVLYWWQAPFIILGLLTLLWKPSRPKLFVLGLFLLFPLAGALSRGSPSSNRALLGAVTFAIITAFGVFTLVRIGTAWQRPWGLKTAGLGLAGALLIGTTTAASSALASYLDAYHGEYKQISAGYSGWQWGPREIIQRFVAVEDEYDELVMDGMFNAPGIFRRFYAPEGCKKCKVGHWDKYDSSKKQLFALRPESMWFTYEYDVKEVLRYPNGKPAFVLAEIAGTRASLRGNLPNRTMGDSEEPLAVLDSAVELNPGLPEPYFDRANAYLNLGDLEAAVADYDTAIELGPNLAPAYNNRGNAHWKLGNLRRATADYAKAIELDARLAPAHYNFANAGVTLGRYDNALSRYSRAIELAPENAEAYTNRGNTYRQLGKLDLAIADFDKATMFGPMLAEAYAGRGRAYGQLGEYTQAIVDLDYAIELDPTLALGHSSRGVVYQDVGELDQAMADFDKAIDLDPRYAEAYANRASTYAKLGDLERAIADNGKAIALDGDYSLAYANRGIAYLSLGDFERAIADLDKAAGLDHAYALARANHPKNPYWSLGEFHEGTEKLKQALSRASNPDSIAQLEEIIDYLVSRDPAFQR